MTTPVPIVSNAINEKFSPGILIQPAPTSHDADYTPSAEQSSRIACVQALVDYCVEAAALASHRDVVIHIDEAGQVKVCANKFIKAFEPLMLVNMDVLRIESKLFFKSIIPNGSLKLEELLGRLKAKDRTVHEIKDPIMLFDNFTESTPFAIAILAAVKKIESTPYADLPPQLKLFSHYWKALPHSGVNAQSNILLNWTEGDWALLKGLSCYPHLQKAKLHGEEIFSEIVVPFLQSFGDKANEIFPMDQLDAYHFFEVVSMVGSRSFGGALLPIFDLLNGRPAQQNNVELLSASKMLGTSKANRGLASLSHINAGDELLLKFAQSGNEFYVLAYNNIPPDRRVIMRNEETAVYLRIREFCEIVMKDLPPRLRERKLKFTFETMHLPPVPQVQLKHVKVPWRDSFNTDIVQPIRQTVIFLMMDEQQSEDYMRTHRLRFVGMDPAQFHSLFSQLISTSMAPFPLGEVQERLLTSKPVPTAVTASVDISSASAKRRHRIAEITRSALFLRISEHIVVECLRKTMLDLVPLGPFIDMELVPNDWEVLDDTLSIMEEKDSKGMHPFMCSFCGSRGTIKLSRCSRCNRSYYCSKDCQREHFPLHKSWCQQNATRKAMKK